MIINVDLTESETNLALENFDNKIKELGIKHKEFLSQNELNILYSYLIFINEESIVLNITDEIVENKFGDEIRQLFLECF